MSEQMTAERALAACATAAAQAAAAAAEAARTSTHSASLAARAIELATGAQATIDSHERLCTLRQEHKEKQDADTAALRISMHSQNQEAIKGVQDSIRRLYGANWKLAGASILVLLGVIGFLIAKHGI